MLGEIFLNLAYFLWAGRNHTMPQFTPLPLSCLNFLLRLIDRGRMSPVSNFPHYHPVFLLAIPLHRATVQGSLSGQTQRKYTHSLPQTHFQHTHTKPSVLGSYFPKPPREIFGALGTPLAVTSSPILALGLAGPVGCWLGRGPFPFFCSLLSSEYSHKTGWIGLFPHSYPIS